MEKLEQLLNLNVNGFTEKKNGLTYLSWANAWREFLRVYPNATYTIAKDENNIPCFGNNKMGYMVYTTVTVDNITHEMWLPVMDFRNKSILEPSSFDVNKTIMRCLTKNLAMFGLGLYIYAGEDIPEEGTQQANPEPTPADLIRRALTQLPKEVGDKYRVKLNSKELQPNQETLELICRENNIKC